jgi:molecular chaperone IbpA
MAWDFNHSFKDFDRFFVGFDPIIKKLSDAAEQSVKLAQTYPPYNIKKLDENKYSIEIAVAGFGKQDLDIEIVDDKLIIKGNGSAGFDQATQDQNGQYTWPTYLYQGLAQRAFTRTFNLADNVEIRGASLLNGILKIALEAIVPEHKKPKKVEIYDDEEEAQAPSTSEYLAERKAK